MNLKHEVKKYLILLLFIGSFFLYGCSKEEVIMIPIHSTEIETEDKLDTKEDIIETEENIEIETYYIFISGAIENPGVYEITENSRLYEVIKMAGGLTDNASPDFVNQARKVMDGEQITIPTIEEVEKGLVVEVNQLPNESKENGNNLLVNINTATEVTLCTINGVGESRAKAIIAFRDNNGDFSKIEDIMKVDGIKEGLFNKMKEEITVK